MSDFLICSLQGISEGLSPSVFARMLAELPDEEVQALVRSLLPPLALYIVADAAQAH